MLLPTAGTSCASEQTELLDRLRATFPDMKIAALIGGPELVGDAWMAYMLSSNHRRCDPLDPTNHLLGCPSRRCREQRYAWALRWQSAQVRGWRARRSYAGHATSRTPAVRCRGPRVCGNLHSHRPA